MKILALEFSSDRRSVAVMLEGRIAGEAHETGGRESHPFRLIEAALAGARIEREAIDTLAVGLGPGSYNGIRCALAVAQGWQLARESVLKGIGSAAAVARADWKSGTLGRVNVVIDAQRGEFYLAAFDLTAEGGQEIEPLHLVTKAEVSARLDAAQRIIGPDASRWWPSAVSVYPAAAEIAELVQRGGPSMSGGQLEPIYLRPVSFVKAPPPRVIPGI